MPINPLPTYSLEAHESVLLEAMKLGQDPHSAFYCWFNGIPYELIGGSRRAAIKPLNNQVIYSESFMQKVAQLPKEK